ncbi:MAG: YybH family protein [Chitinophagaceae bacterium]
MRKLLILSILIGCSVVSPAQKNARQKILTLLDTQTQAWNRGDLEGFMKGYWENDSLRFIGKSGITYGYNNTLNNYKRGYPDTAAMGKLQFTILVIKKLSPRYYEVVGKWYLKRSIGDVSGHYTLLLRKINSKWVIVSDHSS